MSGDQPMPAFVFHLHRTSLFALDTLLRENGGSILRRYRILHSPGEELIDLCVDGTAAAARVRHHLRAAAAAGSVITWTVRAIDEPGRVSA